MSDDSGEEGEDLTDLEIFNISEAEVGYSRSRDTKRVTMIVRDPAGVSEMKLYLIMCLEVEKLERRLGISGSIDTKH